MDASTLAQTPHSMIEELRKIVKRVGKEPVFVRVTEQEKRQIQAISYTYGAQGVDTSDNQICRIAINYILEDYQTNGKESVLARVLDALNA